MKYCFSLGKLEELEISEKQIAQKISWPWKKLPNKDLSDFSKSVSIRIAVCQAGPVAQEERKY